MSGRESCDEGTKGRVVKQRGDNDRREIKLWRVVKRGEL